MIKDSRGHEIYLVLEDSVLSEIKEMKNANEIKSVLLVLSSCMISSEALASSLRKSTLEIEAYLAPHRNIIAKYADPNRKAYYAPAPDFLSGLECGGCDYKKMVEGVIQCKWKGNCQTNHKRACVGIVDQALKNCGLTKVRFTDSLINNKRKDVEPTKPVWEWNVRDFVDYIYCAYLPYSHLIKMTKGKIRKSCTTLKNIFEVEFEENWQFALKNYIRDSVCDSEDKDRVLSLHIACKKEAIQRWVNGTGVWRYQFCTKKRIYCPYYKKFECSIGKEKCTKSLRKQIKRKYN